jgi:hypothetical protein
MSMGCYIPNTKASQTLASYAYEWVKYFTNEANVNGMLYSKYGQYTYFMWGIHNRFAPIKKFLEQEFKPHHDQMNNIPISLELHNLPATITSIARVHGISIGPVTGQIQQVLHDGDSNDTPSDYPTNDPSSVLESIQQLSKNVSTTTRASGHQSTVQCWLCDGPHTFRECKELQRLHNVCAKRPILTKYITKMMKSTRDDATKKISIKVILDTYEDLLPHTEALPLPTDTDETIQAIINSFGTASTLTQPTNTTHNNRVSFADDIEHINAINTTEADYDQDHDCYITHEHFSSAYDSDDDFHLHDYYGTDNIASVADGYTTDALTYDFKESHINSVMIQNVARIQLDISGRAQVDSAADRTTTPHRELIHDFRLPDPSRGDLTCVGDAGVHTHKIMGYGFFHIKAYCFEDNKEVILKAPCTYIPSIPSTLMNFLDVPHCMVAGELVDFRSGTAYRLVELEHDKQVITRLKVPLVRINCRLYTEDRLIPYSPSIQTIRYDLTGPVIQRIISDEPTRLLWHTRFGHLNFRCLSSLHRSVLGLPVIKDAHQVDNCPSCLESKLRRSPAGHGSMITKSTSYGQVIAGDWGFMCTKSDDDQRVHHLQSVYGDTSYLILTCAFSGAIFGACGSSKAVPIDWLDQFFLSHLAQSSPLEQNGFG